ncbi:phosphatase PAP2 family protein [Rhodobacter calidifons]|uniref:Phosphatase PAP2 family protein n=1 Tax=Rhodobacter calidifons TaxID=2715277 RepID=A0ABX0G7Z1_9RHOB|nr:phosphatase PAP2 family protein [Rhodobacter calidifons]NHB77395.1 phosphatase PAP2 family protein [Rhodobacter calidifons]
MKHAGSRDQFLAAGRPEGLRPTPGRRLAAAVRRQSRLSWLGTFACALLLVAVVADGAVRDLARSLDPSVVAVLRGVTQFGNSAWPIGISLLLLGAVTIVARQANPFPREALRNLRSALLLVLGSVAISGTIASLTKNLIGRARPSTGDAQVFEFAAMTFRAGWAAFPSGHSTTAIACAIALAVALPRQAFFWLALGLLTALSRAFLGVHWLSDCLAGLALGTLVTLALRDWMERRGHRFRIDPALLPQVLGRGAWIGLSALWVHAGRAARRAGLWVSQRLSALKSGR